MNVGNQTHIEARFDCIDPVVLKLLAECLGFGANKYGHTNYLNISVEDHLNHAMNHINEHRRGDVDELHLVNAIARIHFAISCLYKQGSYSNAYWHPDMQKQVPDTTEVNVTSQYADPIPVVEYRDVVEEDIGSWIHVRNGSNDGWSNVVLVKKHKDKEVDCPYLCKDHTGSKTVRYWKYAKTVVNTSYFRDPIDSDTGSQVFARNQEDGHWYDVKLAQIRSPKSNFRYGVIDWVGEPYDFKYGEVKVLVPVEKKQ